jgi:cytidine deaminase
MTQLNDQEIKKLIEIAKEARENAFVHRSGHKIGAAVLSTDGEYFGGCNTESVISSLGVCAEMSAIDHAVVHGKYEFKAVAVVSSEMVYPCGACLQYMALFYQINLQDIEIVVADTSDNFEISKLTTLLPHKYLTENNIEEIKKYKNK